MNEKDIVEIEMPKWVISDTHFGHYSPETNKGIRQYCLWRRKWSQTIEEHDALIISEWNKIVQPNDWVLHLGDFSLGKEEVLRPIRKALAGHIILVHGNHDRSIATMKRVGFDQVCSAISFKHGKDVIIGRHNPASFSLRDMERAKVLVHGHLHGNGFRENEKVHPSIAAKCKDCSLDALESIGPVSLTQLLTSLQ